MPTSVVEAGNPRPDWSTLTDDLLVERIRAGESALFEVLMRRYNQRLYRVARAILRDESEAEDVMQHAYVAAYTHIETFAGRARFSTWLTKIAVYEALARARRRQREAVAAPQRAGEDAMSLLTSSAPDPEKEALTRELRALLESAIEALPPRYRAVFVLREVEGLDTAETAACLDVSENVVKTRLHRARALLRKALFQRAGLAGSAAFPFHLSRCDRVVAGVFGRLALGPPRIH
jgi:RNA polymerase sigma-70 factor (ECF subfamily)